MSNQPRPLKPIEAFRIVAWKACVYAEERWKLGPIYYCPTCDLSVKDLSAGCPKCPLTELFLNCYKRAAITEIESRGGLPVGFTVDQLISTHGIVSRIFAENGEQISKEWDEPFVQLVRIVQQERAQQSYIRDWNSYQQMKSKK